MIIIDLKNIEKEDIDIEVFGTPDRPSSLVDIHYFTIYTQASIPVNGKATVTVLGLYDITSGDAELTSISATFSPNMFGYMSRLNGRSGWIVFYYGIDSSGGYYYVIASNGKISRSWGS